MEKADPRDIFEAFGVDSIAADILKGAMSPEARVAAALFGALLSQGAEETRVPERVPEPEEAVEEWVTEV